MHRSEKQYFENIANNKICKFTRYFIIFEHYKYSKENPYNSIHYSMDIYMTLDYNTFLYTKSMYRRIQLLLSPLQLY